jgi:hypothetical protein
LQAFPAEFKLLLALCFTAVAPAKNHSALLIAQQQGVVCTKSEIPEPEFMVIGLHYILYTHTERGPQPVSQNPIKKPFQKSVCTQVLHFDTMSTSNSQGGAGQGDLKES